MYDEIFLSKNNKTKREVIKEKTYLTTFTKIKTKDSIPQREKKKRNMPWEIIQHVWLIKNISDTQKIPTN